MCRQVLMSVLGYLIGRRGEGERERGGMVVWERGYWEERSGSCDEMAPVGGFGEFLVWGYRGEWLDMRGR